MSSATSSFESQQQGNGKLKLKIKFSQSRGFVSDFVNEAASDVGLPGHKQFSAALSGSEPLSFSQRAHVSSPASRSEHYSPSLPTHVPSPASRSEPALSLQPTRVSSPVCGGEPLSSLQKTHLFSSTHWETNDQHQFSCQFEETGGVGQKHRSTDSKSKHADLPGVNYGKVLQDLEFLSGQQDKLDGRDTSLVCGQGERHLMAKSSVMHVQKHQQAAGEPEGVTEGIADMADTPVRAELSEEEPLSPFDINCSLGLADEDFTFAASTQSPSSKQSSRKDVKENSLFPWSVDISTNSNTHCANRLSLSHQPERGSKLCVGGMNSAGSSYGDGIMNSSAAPSLEQRSYKGGWRHEATDSSKRASTLGFQPPAGLRLDSEINNNSYAQFHNSTPVFRSESNYQTGTVHMLHNVATDVVRNSGVNLAMCSVGYNTNSSAGAKSENPHSINRTLSLDSALGGQDTQSSVWSRHLSGCVSDVQLSSPSVLCQRLSANLATDTRTSNQACVNAASEDPSSLQHVPRKESSGEESVLVKLLTRRYKLPNSVPSAGPLPDETVKQLAENPPSVELLPAPLTSQITEVPAAEASPALSETVTGVTSIQLGHTINELRKRVAGRVPPDVTSEGGPPGEVCSTQNLGSSSSNAKKTPSKVGPWCKCENPELIVLSKDHENVSGIKVPSDEKICKKCWKRLKSQQKRKVLPVWCRCDSPDPHTPDGTVTEMCRKCEKRVSKKWTKRIAAKWCKCHTPVLCTFTQTSDKDGNVSHTFYICKRCQKWISKDREDVCMKGDRFGQLPGEKMGQEKTDQLPAEKVTPPMCPQPLITDHNYSLSPFLPNEPPKAPDSSSASAVHQTAQREQLAELQSNHVIFSQAGAQGAGGPKIIYVFPRLPNAVPSSSGMQSHIMQSGPLVGGSGLSLLGVPKMHTASSALLTLCSAAASSTTGSSGSVSSSSTVGLHYSSAFAAAPSSSGDYPGQKKAPVPGTSQSGALPVLAKKKRVRIRCKLAPGPAWLKSISKDFLHPCCVVLETLTSQSLPDHGSGPCSVSCRQNALNDLCRQGDLQQCGHSLRIHDASSTMRISDWNRKKTYFRQNQTMVGYEEFRQKELDERKLNRRRATLSAGEVEYMNNISSTPRFFPLASPAAHSFTHVRISPQDGFRIQHLPENVSDPGSVGDHLQSTSSQGIQKNANGMERRSPGSHSSHFHTEKRKHTHTDGQGGSTWLKTSQFHVKYYVFGAQGRAFMVPLFQKKRHAQTVPQLDEEDMGYVKEVIKQLLVEKDSCARHLTYPDSLQHKQTPAMEGECASKKTFVAPTLGGEDLDIEGLKSLISDRDFSRLVPRNTRISKSKYLQEIGEKVHMYLTGGSEEAPEWIKDVAKSIVMKQRKRPKSNKRTRLRPSKNVSIEIDYAEEETLEVGEEGMLSPSHSSVADGDLVAPGSSMTSFEMETAHPGENLDQYRTTEADHTSHQTGSFVVTEAFAQEEKKPLIQNMFETVMDSSMSAAEGSVPAPGQQILIPLPGGCSCGQEPEGHTTSASCPPLSISVHQQHVNDPLDSEERQDQKPLLGELLAASTFMPFPTSTEWTSGSEDMLNAQVHQHHAVATPEPPEPTEHQPAPWPLAFVKEEPPDDDYSHAWPDQDQAEGTASQPSAGTSQNKGAELGAIPFISNSTFGREAVQIEDEEGYAALNLDQPPLIDSGTEVQSVIKMEPHYVGDFETPFIMCIASGEFATVFANPGHSETSGVEGSASQILSAHNGTVAHSADVHPPVVVHVAACTEAAATDHTTAHIPCPEEQKPVVGLDTVQDAVTFGELVCRSVENSYQLFENKDCGAGNADEQTQVLVMPQSCDVPQISALSFGEAAKLWDTADDAHSAETSAVVDQSETAHQMEVIPVISSVFSGEAVVHEDDDEIIIFRNESENENELEADPPGDYNEEYYEDFHEDDDYCEEDGDTDVDPNSAVIGAGQVVAIPMVFPSGSDLPEAREDPPLIVPLTVGVDLSLVKQEPQEVGEPSASSAYTANSDLVSECTVILPSRSEDVNPAVEDSSPGPAILEVRSLAFMKLPAKSGRDADDSPKPPQRSQNHSPVRASSLLAQSLKRLKRARPYSANTKRSASRTRSCVTKVREGASDESSQQNTSEKSENEQTLSTSRSRSAETKAKSKNKNGKPAAKRKQQLTSSADQIERSPHSVQQLSEGDNSTLCDNTVPGANSVAPPESSPPRFSRTGASSPASKTDDIEHEGASTNLELGSTIQLTSNVPSEKSLTVSEVIPSDAKSTTGTRQPSDAQSTTSTRQNILDDGSVVFPRAVPFMGDVSLADKRSFPFNVQPANYLTEQAEAEGLTSPSATAELDSGVCKDAAATDSHAKGTTPLRREVTPPETDSQFYAKDSQPIVQDASQSDLTQVLRVSAQKETSVYALNKRAPNVNNVPENESAPSMHASDDETKRQDNGREVSPTGCIGTQSNSPLAAETPLRATLPAFVQENEGESQNTALINSPLPGSVDRPPSHFSDLQEQQEQHSLATKVIDCANPDHEKMTPVVTCQSASLETEDSHTLPKQPDDTTASDDVKDTVCSVKKRTAKTCKGRRTHSRSERRKRSCSKSGTAAVGFVASETTVPDPYPNTADSNSQDRTLATDDKMLSNAPSSQAESDKRDSPVITLKITRSSVVSPRCLSINQVSSSCDVPAISETSNTSNADTNELKSWVPSDQPKENTEKKGTDLGSEGSSLHLVQSLRDSSEQPENQDTTNTSDRSSIIDESAHYVSQIFERSGKRGRTCLVLRKKRPAESPSLPPAPAVDPSESSATGKSVVTPSTEQDSPVPRKKIKEDTVIHNTTRSKTEETQPGSEPRTGNKGVKRKSHDTNVDGKGDRSSKAPRLRSIFSDMSAVLSSLSASPSGSTSSAASSKPCSPQSGAGSGLTKVLAGAAAKVSEKGFNMSLFSRLRASLGSVKDKKKAAARKPEEEESECRPSSTVSVSVSSAASLRERSFFDCLPQGFVNAWKKK